MTHSISLQPILAKEEIELLSSLILSPISSDLPPLQVVQYQFLCKWFDKGEIGWAEFLLLSAGGAGSVPSPNTSYAMLIIFHLVCALTLACVTTHHCVSAQGPGHRGHALPLARGFLHVYLNVGM
jgi:hypothetical protein